jgi:hypothetical protein
MDIIIYSVLVLFSFLIYINYNKIFLFLFKKAEKDENNVQIDDEKNSKRKKLGSPRKDK